MYRLAFIVATLLAAAPAQAAVHVTWDVEPTDVISIIVRDGTVRLTENGSLFLETPEQVIVTIGDAVVTAEPFSKAGFITIEGELPPLAGLGIDSGMRFAIEPGGSPRSGLTGGAVTIGAGPVISAGGPIAATPIPAALPLLAAALAALALAGRARRRG
jgi:hypothetical protein